MASGPALKRRWGVSANSLPPEHPAWDLEARYIASALASFILTLSPQRIILGGGVMAQAHLFPLIRKYTLANLAGYVQLARELRTPVQLGENFYGPRDLLQAVEAGAGDLVMPDLMRIGGVSGWTRAVPIAAARGNTAE